MGPLLGGVGLECEHPYVPAPFPSFLICQYCVLHIGPSAFRVIREAHVGQSRNHQGQLGPGPLAANGIPSRQERRPA